MYFAFISPTPWLHLSFLYWRYSAWARKFILQSMSLTFPVLFLFELFRCGNRNDLFWKPWLYSHDLICKLLNVFHTDGVKGSQNYITMNSAFVPQCSHHDLDSITISPLLVSFMSASKILHSCSQSTEGNREELPARIELVQVPQDRSSLYFLWRRNISHLYKTISMWLRLPFYFLKQSSWYSIPFLQKKKKKVIISSDFQHSLYSPEFTFF